MKTLADFGYEEGGKIMISKQTFFDTGYEEDYGFGNQEVNDKEMESQISMIRDFGIDHPQEVIKLALKKSKMNIEETILMLTSDQVENLQKELADLEEHKAFVPIINKEEKVEDSKEEAGEEESKLNLILSNKSEYFDLLFDLLNLGVNEINIQAWNLLTQIPVNKKLYSNIKELNIKKDTDWNSLMDPQNMYKLLYSLQIINSLICSPDTENLIESELQERYEWRLRFLKLGGFEHLIKILLNQNNIEDSLKLQRRARITRKKNKAEDQGKINYSIHKAGCYMINIIKIFTQASLLAKSSEDNLLYSIISQSATSPFKRKVKAQPQGSNINMNTLLIDFSDTSKDNSSNNTPNFASPKSANAPSGFWEGGLGLLDGDYEIIGPKEKPKDKPKVEKEIVKGNSSICTQVDDFQKLIDQVTGGVEDQILNTVKFEKLCTKLLQIVYYAVRTIDQGDKSITMLIDSCLDLVLPCVVANPDELIPVLYSFHNFEGFIVSALRYKGDENIRKNVSNTFKAI